MSSNATDAEPATSDKASDRLPVDTLDAVTALPTSRLPTTVPDAADPPPRSLPLQRVHERHRRRTGDLRKSERQAISQATGYQSTRRRIALPTSRLLTTVPDAADTARPIVPIVAAPDVSTNATEANPAPKMKRATSCQPKRSTPTGEKARG